MTSIALAGCGQYDCTSGDVHDVLLDLVAGERSGVESSVESMFGVGTSDVARGAFAAARLSGVVMRDRNADTGYYRCQAKVSIQAPDGTVFAKDLEYEVTRVESADADFEVSALESELGELRRTVNAHINAALRDERAREAEAASIAQWQATPAVAMTDEEVLQAVLLELQREIGHFNEREFALLSHDVNGDGYREYVALWNDDSMSSTRWKMKTFHQAARAPGQPTTLRGLEPDLFRSDRPIRQAGFDGDVLTVSDGAGWSDARTLSGWPVHEHAPAGTGTPGQPATVVSNLPAAYASPADDQAAIARFVDRLLERSDRPEAAQPRMVLAGDLNGDGEPDAAVLFAVQDRDNERLTWLLKLLREEGHLRLAGEQVVAQYTTTVEAAELEGALLHLSVTRYVHDGATCCVAEPAMEVVNLDTI